MDRPSNKERKEGIQWNGPRVVMANDTTNTVVVDNKKN
jgi:hypothetical protein